MTKKKPMWNIKNWLLPLVLLSGVLSGCKTEGTAAFKGDYSFKTGGYITVSGTYTDWRGSRDTTFIRNLVPESGQMHLLQDTEEQKMVVTMNITGGDPVVFSASLDGEQLVLTPLLRRVLVFPKFGDDALRYNLTVGGTGRKYDQTIVFEMNYSGDFPMDGLKGAVTSSKVHCIATKND